MTAEPVSTGQVQQQTRVIHQGGTSEALYGLGMIGAWVYYFTHAATFWIGVLGFFKGLFWPAFMVYELMKFLGM